MGRPTGNRSVDHGRRADDLPYMREALPTRYEPLSKTERYQLWEVCNRCLVDEPAGMYVNGGREKVARLVAEEILRRNPRFTEGCSHVTISKYIAGSGVHPVRREAIRAILPALLETYFPEGLKGKPEPRPWSSLSPAEKIAVAYEKLPPWRRKLVAQAAGLVDDDGNVLL